MELEEANAKLGNMERKTVRFNVGGTIYEVSRTLINQFPDTMLARLSSETWSPESNGEPLFIERDGDRFRYCLDYMRDGGIVDLPATVSKAAMLRDLEYYGFQEVDPSTISQAPSITNEDFRKAWTKNYWQLQENAKKSEQDAQNDNDVAQLASVCATLVSGRRGKNVSDSHCIFLREEGGMMVIECMRPGTTYRKHGSKEQIRKIYAVHNTAKRLYLKSDWYVSRFQKHLKRHGLMFVKCEESNKTNYSSLLNIYLKTL